jgi:hypothetical protein
MLIDGLGLQLDPEDSSEPILCTCKRVGASDNRRAAT